MATYTWQSRRTRVSPSSSATYVWQGSRQFQQPATIQTETSTGVLAFSGISFAGATHRNETSTGAMAFAGISFAGSTHRSETSSGGLAFSGISFVASAAPEGVTSGALAFSGISFAGSTHEVRSSSGALAFAGISFAATTQDTTAGGGLAFAGLAFASATDSETGQAAMAFGPLAFTAHGGASPPTMAAMHFAGLSFLGFIGLETSIGAMAFAGISFDAGGGGRAMELDVAVLAAPPVDAQVSEVDIAAVVTPADVVARVAELDVSVVAVPNETTLGQIPELDIAALVYYSPCATSRCQVWKITLKTGAVYAFTSLDVPITWQGVTYTPCKSLSSTASESSSELKSVGNVELTGILDSDHITDEDLYSGLFDDAFVEVWVIPYDGQPDDQAPFRQAAGWLGKVTRGEYNFTADVVGPGARMTQTAIVDFYTPGCRWDFGVLDANGIGCPVDADANAILNIPVTGSTLRSLIDFTAADPGAPVIWNEGTITWQTGRNAGVVCQVETVDFGAQALSLWDLVPFPPAIGDLFTLKPGCPKTSAGCTVYDVFTTGFGGFPDVPGPDALQSNADSLFT